MSFDLAIYNVTVVSPQSRYRSHIYIRGGKIAQMSLERHDAAEKIDGSGLYAMPGMIDGHVHFMDPAETDREDFITGSSAAAVGGVTTVIEHTHAGPVRTRQELEEKRAYLSDRSLVDFGLAAHIWPDHLADLAEVWAAGASYLKMFTCTTHGVPGLSNAEIYKAFETAAAFDGLVVAHCEDETLTEVAEQELRQAHLEGGDVIPLWRNRAAEALAVNTITLTAQITGARMVVAHASSPGVIQMAAERRAAGARISVEGCPQYFYLREEEVHQHGALRKFTPPARLRAESEAEEMWLLLREGAITHVSSDHAPSTAAQKAQGVWESPFGLPGVETTLPLLLKAVSQGRLSLERVVEAVCEAPARLYGFYPHKGRLAEGVDADIVLLDMAARKTLQNSDVVSKAGWSPFAGTELQGLPVMTFSRGRPVAQEGRPVGEPGWGRFLAGKGGR